MKKKRAILLLLMTLNLLVLSGCWDMREINELGLVTAVGIDKADSPNRYIVTVQIANPSSQSSGSGQSSAKSEVWIGSEEGPSLFDAARKLVKTSSRRIMWAHNNVVIIGESLAKEGIIPVVDYFTHNPELRMKAAIVIADGAAKDYIVAKIGMDSPPGVSFGSLMGYRALAAESVESQLLEVSSSLKSKYANPLISKISLKETESQSGDSESKDSGNSKIVELSGAAAFKKDKMVGWLSSEESRGIAWILNQTKNTAVTVADSEHADKSVVVETTGVKAKIKTEVVDGKLKISIRVSGKGDIVEEDGQTIQDMSETKGHITELLNKSIENEIKKSLELVQKKYMVDCLGFAAIVHAENDKEWENGLKDKWEEVFPKIPITVSVSINIKSSTLNQQPMYVY